MSYLTIVKWTNSNHIAKYQKYNNKSDADAHALQHGGFVVVEPEKPYALSYLIVDEGAKTVTYDKQAYDASQDKIKLENEILGLEISVTPRRLREALMTQSGKDWLDNVDSLIAIERAKL